MQIKLYLTLFVGLFSQLLGAQNLVTNPSFETLSQCPTIQSPITITYTTGWIKGFGTPDLFNSCSNSFPTSAFGMPQSIFGNQYPFEGETYAGFILYGYNPNQPPNVENVREYLCTELSCNLKAGKQYHVGFHFSHGDNSQFALNSLGLKFLPALPAVFPLPSNLTNATTEWTLTNDVFHDTVNWILFEDTITATGQERFLTLGNFHSLTNSIIQTINPSGTIERAYYYIDNVFVIPLDTADYKPEIDILGGDKYLCLDENYVFDLNGFATSASWQDTIYDLSYQVSDTGLVNVSARINECNYIDSVNILLKDECKTYVVFPNVFTPNGDGINDFFSPIEINRIKKPILKIKNRWGNTVYSTTNLEIPWDGTENGNPCPDGVYYWFIDALEFGVKKHVSFNDSGFFTLQR